jgi:hypothetical protein
MGVSVNDTMPEIRMAKVMTRPNSLNMRPTTPPMNNTGMNTATRDSVIEMMVKPTSLEPLKAASIGFSPASMWRTMFSSMTMASSTTKPTASVSASSEMLSSEWPQRYMPAKVPITEIGSAIAGISVARKLRRKK